MIKREIICDKCFYKWMTKSQMYYTSCPKCQAKVNIKKQLNIKEDNGAERSFKTN